MLPDDRRDINNNPYIHTPERAFEEYQMDFPETTRDPNDNETKYAALCYGIFSTEAGKKWLAETKMRQSDIFIQLDHSNSALGLASAQGVRQFLAMLEQIVNGHSDYIKATKG